ncbi:MAG: putative electron transfer flavoprotein FixA [Bellilinea sp.]
MNLIVCYKFVPDPEDMQVKPDGRISFEGAEWIISDYDLMAIETAVRLAEAHGGKVTALSAGPQPLSSSKGKKDVLSRGPDELALVVDNALQDADTHQTAQALAAAIRKIGEFDLVIFGEGSADLYFQQVGLQVGELLGVPVINAVVKAAVMDNRLVVERSAEDDVQVLETSLPAAIAVTTDICQPRLPSMKEILKAGKKPVTEWSLADLGLDLLALRTTQTLALRPPDQVERKRIKISGEPDQAVQQLLNYLSKEGVL